MTLLRKIIEVYHEQAMVHKAMRILAKQDWSVEFLTALCVKAAKQGGRPIEMVIRAPNRAELVIRSVDAKVREDLAEDDDILNNLDNDAMVDAYIRRHGK